MGKAGEKSRNGKDTSKKRTGTGKNGRTKEVGIARAGVEREGTDGIETVIARLV
jgi:hypothetical protein